jgi:hypothetical protein
MAKAVPDTNDLIGFINAVASRTDLSTILNTVTTRLATLNAPAPVTPQVATGYAVSDIQTYINKVQSIKALQDIQAQLVRLMVLSSQSGSAAGSIVTEDSFGNTVLTISSGAAGVPGTFTLNTLLYELALGGITAGTTRTQAGATALTNEISQVDTSTAPAAGSTLGDGVRLDQIATAGLDATVINNTLNPIQVYGNGTDTINGIAGSTGIPIPPGDVAHFECGVTGSWRTEAGVGSAGALPVEISVTGITAGTTRTQAGATALPAVYNRVDTSTAPANGSTLGDGVLLKAAAAGLDQVVVNNTVNIISVWPAGSDQINGLGASNSIPIPPGDVAVFVAAGTTAWHVEAGVGSAGAIDCDLAVDNVTATTGGQAGAVQLVAANNRVVTATAGYGCALPPATRGGMVCLVANHSGQQIVVYGNNAAADIIDDIPTATGLSVMDSSVVIFSSYGVGKWYTDGAATGYAKNPQSGVALGTIQFADNLTALTGGQSTSLQLTAAINTFATVPVGGGGNLPASSPGLQVVINNNGVNPLQIYPAQGATDTINGLAATVGVSLHRGTSATFNCTVAGAWLVQPTSPVAAAFNTNSAASGTTLTAANISGGVASVDLAMTGAVGAGANAQLPTVASLVNGLHAPTIGTSYRLRIINEGNSSTVWTVTTNTGWTLTGTMTIAQNTWREFVVTLTSLTTATIQNCATGTFS